MKICIHEIEYQIDITIIFCSYNILKSDNVFVARKLLQENDLSKSALGIRCILKSIKILLQCHNLFGLLIDSLPDNTVSTLSY